jgi:Thioesterase superfamily
VGDRPLSGRRGLSGHVPGAEIAGRPAAEVTDELLDRREAVAELAAELRTLADLLARTEAGAGVLRDSARRLREAAPALRERLRDIAEPASVDDLAGGIRMFNPVIGDGNPIAPPLRVEMGANGAEGWCTLGQAYEGPPMYGHGGISAMLIDQLLGHAAASSGHPGVTTDLSVRYRRPVPLDVPLRVWGRVTDVRGRRVSVVGGITTAAEPDVPLVEAEGRFARLRPDQAGRLFGRLASPDATNPDVAHD